MPHPILACETWSNNGELIAEVARLYFKPEHWILDTTYGRGVWWKKYKHERLVKLLPGDSFTDLPYDDGEFDVVCYDPPYVSTGGRETSGLQEFLARFGLYEAPRTPEALQLLCNQGAAECRRVLKPGGLLLWKNKEYVSSGHLYPGLMNCYNYAAIVMGMRYQDHFILHRKKPMPQPSRTRADGRESVQQHARRNCSHLLVFKKVPARVPF